MKLFITHDEIPEDHCPQTSKAKLGCFFFFLSFVAWPIFPEAVAGSTLQKSSKFRGKHSCWRLVFNTVIDLGL